MNNKMDKILAEISAGELIDKITILEIKKAKISDKEKLNDIEKELLSLNETVKKFVPNQDSISKYINDLKTKNPDIIWVSLGFPKQEQFINKLKSEVGLNSNFVGIGAVFEWVAGTKVKAPEILANIGLEWIFRLLQEPKRLYKRYFIDNSLFIIYFIKQLRSK